jgi:hypothetical protein
MLSLAQTSSRDEPIAVATSRSGRVEDAVAEIRSSLAYHDPALLIVFFSPRYNSASLARQLSNAFPGVRIAGCSTAGEMSPEGICDDTIVAVGFDRSSFTIITRCMTELSTLSMRRTRQFAADALREMRESRQRSCLSRAASGDDSGEVSPDHTFALLLTDGMSHLEEKLVAGLSASLVNIPLVGGSAGDGLRFRKTHVIHGEEAHSDAAVFALITCRFPMMTFSASHFSPTPVKLVVTSADVERRIVRELNGAPAASEYAAALGLSGQPLSPTCFAAHPVVVRVGGGYYVRSIQQVNDDGSLSFLCAIDEGIVLSLAKANDIVGSTERTFEKVRTSIGEPQLVLAFECIWRRVEAELQQADRELADIYRRNNVVGFHTYGEQCKTLHLNQTFSGIAIGR